MKVLFDHPSPFLLAHGGFQIQIEQTKAALEKIGVEVEYLRWWDESQRGDLIHYFGRPSESYIDFAHQKGMKVVVAELHTGLGSRSGLARFAQKRLMQIAQTVLPSAYTSKLNWKAYQKADAFSVNTSWEKFLITSMFNAEPSKVHVIPNGVEDIFFQEPRTKNQEHLENRSDFLVCTATITERKRVLELAEAAVQAQTPLWIIGKPYSETDPYFLRFVDLQKQYPETLRYEGAISSRVKLAEIYQQARGFVLLSSMETRSLSSEEAAASGCALLLSDLPWAWSTFESRAYYCPITCSVETTAAKLKAFYNHAPTMTQFFTPLRWTEIARQLQSVYLSTIQSIPCCEAKA
jgi:glycosyltransferase involved in cell wall biosynthesis